MILNKIIYFIIIVDVGQNSNIVDEKYVDQN